MTSVLLETAAIKVVVGTIIASHTPKFDHDTVCFDWSFSQNGIGIDLMKNASTNEYFLAHPEWRMSFRFIPLNVDEFKNLKLLDDWTTFHEDVTHYGRYGYMLERKFYGDLAAYERTVVNLRMISQVPWPLLSRKLSFEVLECVR